MSQKLVTKKNAKVQNASPALPGRALQDLLPAGLPESGREVRTRRARQPVVAVGSRAAYPGPSRWSVSITGETRSTLDDRRLQSFAASFPQRKPRSPVRRLRRLGDACAVRLGARRASRQSGATAGWFDVSHLGRFSWKGPGASAALNRLLTNDVTSDRARTHPIHPLPQRRRRDRRRSPRLAMGRRVLLGACRMPRPMSA